MKRFVAALALVMISAPAFANDGGVAAITVNQIKMREMKDDGTVARKIAEPNFEITLEGGEAKKLMQILPSEFSVVTAMQPELKKEFDNTFKTLAIQSQDSNGVKGKVISISCQDGKLEQATRDGIESKLKIVKSGKTECQISITAGGDIGSDTTTFTPACKN